MFTKKIKLEVDSREVVNVVRLLGQLGLKFEISDEYSKFDDLDPNRKVWFRRFVIYGNRRELTAFCGAIRIS